VQTSQISRIVAELHRRHRATDPESGQAVSEVLMYSAVIVLVIVAVGAALQALGVEIIDSVRSALGLA